MGHSIQACMYVQREQTPIDLLNIMTQGLPPRTAFNREFYERP